MFRQGRYREALEECQRAIRISRNLPQLWVDVSVNCLKLNFREQAVGYGEQALLLGCRSLELFDALSQAHGGLHKWEEVKKYGLMALQLRDQKFGMSPSISSVKPIMPPLPSMQTRDKNIISFSLFGADSKCCETAVLNVVSQPSIYPAWTCRFYVNDSVPQTVIDRLVAAGAQVSKVDADLYNSPGQMWRFLALNDENLHRVLFRDAGSVISAREAEAEAEAVEEWLHSDCSFHCMRDSPTHTELLVAGLWGVVCRSLPPLEFLTTSFFSSDIQSSHFSDQDFLSQHVWPYARRSLLQHDSLFGFVQARSFPAGRLPEDFCVG